MDKPWLVFGGWAISPDILCSVFGDKSIYVDINEMMKFLFDGEALNENWPDIVKERVNEYLTTDIAGIAGWSTGAIMACKLAQKISVKKLVLFSGTPSFCRREGFKYGQRPSIVQSMINKLKIKNNNVVKDFLIQCGLQANESVEKAYAEDVMVKGLVFLERANLLDGLKKTEARTVVIHGKEDSIIPWQAGETLAGMMGAECKLLNGGHAFFIDQCDEIKRMIE